MAGFDYKKSQKTALGLIKKFGRKAILKRTIAGDPGDWHGGGATFAMYDVTVVMLPATKSTVDNFAISFGANFVMQDLKFGYMAAQMTLTGGTGPDTVAPMPADVIIIGNEEFAVVGSTPLNPAGTPVYYPFAARS